MKRKIFLTFIFLATAILNAGAWDTYQVNPISSAVLFKVSHMGLPLVRGRFEKFNGTIFWEGDKLTGFDGVVDMTSLVTGITARDNDLKSENFFSTEKFPAMTIKSNTITQQANGKVTIQGELTIRDITKPFELRGTVSRPQDKTVDLALKGTINRASYGLWLNNIFEMFVGNNVYISLKLKAEKT